MLPGGASSFFSLGRRSGVCRRQLPTRDQRLGRLATPAGAARLGTLGSGAGDRRAVVARDRDSPAPPVPARARPVAVALAALPHAGAKPRRRVAQLLPRRVRLLEL